MQECHVLFARMGDDPVDIHGDNALDDGLRYANETRQRHAGETSWTPAIHTDVQLIRDWTRDLIRKWSWFDGNDDVHQCIEGLVHLHDAIAAELLLAPEDRVNGGYFRTLVTHTCRMLADRLPWWRYLLNLCHMYLCEILIVCIVLYLLIGYMIPAVMIEDATIYLVVLVGVLSALAWIMPNDFRRDD